MSKWCKENEDFRDFIATSGLSSVTVSYDLLAQSPETEFRRLFEFCGMAFTEELSTLLERRTSCMGGERRQ